MDFLALTLISFTLYPAYISSVVIVGFLFNKSSLNLYFLVVQGLVLYLSLGWGIDVLVHRITLTLPLVHWFQLRLLLVNWEYLVDSLSGIMLVIIALISLNVNVYSVDLLDYDTHQEQLVRWIVVMLVNLITLLVLLSFYPRNQSAELPMMYFHSIDHFEISCTQ